MWTSSQMSFCENCNWIHQLQQTPNLCSATKLRMRQVMAAAILRGGGAPRNPPALSLWQRQPKLCCECRRNKMWDMCWVAICRREEHFKRYWHGSHSWAKPRNTDMRMGSACRAQKNSDPLLVQLPNMVHTIENSDFTAQLHSHVPHMPKHISYFSIIP